MLFSTKAEYGVRLMVELGRQPGDAPGRAQRRRRGASACRSPTSSTWSRSCATPGSSARRAAPTAATASRGPRPRSRWTRWSRRSRARSRRWSASTRRREGKVLCSHETDGDHACATKLLWTRVQGGVTRALAGTTLAELVEFAARHGAPATDEAGRQRRLADHDPNDQNGDKWLTSRSRTCT